MNILGWVATIAGLLAALVLTAGQLGLLAGSAPKRLGVSNGRLKPPSNTPNSVSSQAALYPDHLQLAYASMQPIAMRGDGVASLQKIAAVLRSTPGVALVTEQPDYLYAQCQTPILKFTDDLEFWLDKPAGLIHFRSSSRLGRKDFGVNRARIEAIRAQLEP